MIRSLYCFNLIFLLWIGFNTLLAFLKNVWFVVKQTFGGVKQTFTFTLKAIVEEMFDSAMSIAQKAEK